MPPINPDVPMSMFTRMSSTPSEKDRKNYEARAEVLDKKIKNKTATLDEVSEYKDIKARLATLNKNNERVSIFNQLEENKAEIKKTANNIWNQAFSAISKYSNIFTLNTSDNSQEKEGEEYNE